MYFLFALLFLLSCSTPPPSSPQSSLKTLRMSLSRDPPTLDPRKGSEIVGATLHYMLFEGLVRSAKEGPPSLALAESIDVSPDQKTYTFHLKKTKWSNGEPVTAADFERAWKSLLNPDFPAANAYLLYPIKNAEKAKKRLAPLEEVGIQALNERTLRVTLEQPTPYFLDLLTFSLFFPIPHTIEAAFPEWADKEGPHFVTNGPFKLKQWNHHNEILLERNPFYWEKEHIELDEIFLPIVRDETTALQLFKKGQLDLLGVGISPIPIDALPEYKKKKELHIYPSVGIMSISLNVHQFPFNNKKMRQAFAYAINRQEIVDNITQLEEDPAVTLIPPPLRKGKAPELFPDNSPKTARELFVEGLKELNISSTQLPELVYSYSASELNHRLAQALQSQWLKTLGVTVRLAVNEHKILQHKMGIRDYQMAQVFMLAQYNDPMNILERFKSITNIKNYPGWENSLFTNLLEKSMLETLPDKRAAMLASAEAILIEEMPLIPLYHTKTAFLASPQLQAVPVTPSGTLDYPRIRKNNEQ